MQNFRRTLGVGKAPGPWWDGLLAVLVLAGCALQFKPLPTPAKAATGATQEHVDPRVVYRFFDDDFVAGGYEYSYPDASKVYIPEESGHDSEVSLQFDLDPNDYSGGAVCLYNMSYDLTPYYARGALQFWVKGAHGGEIAWVSLVDGETRDGKKTVVRLPLNNYGGITKSWRLVSIPLSDFSRRGVYWDPHKQVELPNPFDWDDVAEFRVEIKKGDNTAFRIWVDDIFVLRDVFAAKPESHQEYWEDKKETITPPLVRGDKGHVVHTLFRDEIPAGAFTYVYGGKTAVKVQPGSQEDPGILACYLDNGDYSGVTLALGKGHNLDLTELRQGTAGLSFWGKGVPGVQKIYVGLLDNEGNDIKVQTKVVLSDFGPVDTTWHYYQIPLKRFGATGLYWDADRKAEISAPVRWDEINEIRFSVNKGENKVDSTQPASFYVDDMVLVDSIPGYVDPEAYWAAFHSTAPDVLLHDFEGPADQGWATDHGPKSQVTASIVAAKGMGHGKKSLSIDYQLADWCDVMFDYAKNHRPAQQRNWSRYWGLRFFLYTDRAYQGVTVQVNDAGDEIFDANVGGTKGWNEIILPFKDFTKFAYYQPPDAVQNGKFDLDNVMSLDFKPAGDGTRGTYLIDDVSLTNQREVKKAPVLAQKEITVTGDWNQTVTQHINDGIFGINAALWDGDLLNPKTEGYVKAIDHKVLRYPGGLRADVDHWKEVMKNGNGLVNTDQFLAYCRRTGTEPMITVNFGTGTPQEAADWVHYVNVEKKAHVRYWEIGNELYGDWHPNHTTGEDYGKRAAEFIQAMKAVDPSILVSVVWVLKGDWNQEVFKYTRDLADAVSVHHYPQTPGEENDVGLLSAPQSLNEIIPDLRHQLTEYGAPGKHYQLWLTEWNSVSMNPGPQTLSLVNGLFVADYLGMLARYNIAQADYWDIQNNITEQGGDYGYLSRAGAPDGDDVPRPSYYAFKLASESLRGRLVECNTGDDQTSCYLTVNPAGKKTLLFINKYPKTAVMADVKIPGFQGAVTWRQLDSANLAQGGSIEKRTLRQGEKVKFPAYSINAISEE